MEKTMIPEKSQQLSKEMEQKLKLEIEKVERLTLELQRQKLKKQPQHKPMQILTTIEGIGYKTSANGLTLDRLGKTSVKVSIGSGPIVLDFSHRFYQLINLNNFIYTHPLRFKRSCGPSIMIFYKTLQDYDDIQIIIIRSQLLKKHRNLLCNLFLLQLALSYELLSQPHPLADTLVLFGQLVDGFRKCLILKHPQQSPIISHHTQHQQQIHRLVEQGTHLRLVLVDDIFQRHDHLQLHQPLVPLLAIAFHQSLKDSQAIVTFFALQNFRVCPDVKEHVGMVCRTNGQQLFSTDELALSEERVCLESKADSFLLVVFACFDQELREHEAIQEILDGQLPIKDRLLKRFSHIVQLNVECQEVFEVSNLLFSQDLFFVQQELFTEAPGLNSFNAPEYLLGHPLRLSKNLDPKVFYGHSFSQEQKHPSRLLLEILFILKHLFHKLDHEIFEIFIVLFERFGNIAEQFEGSQSSNHQGTIVVYILGFGQVLLSFRQLFDDDIDPSELNKVDIQITLRLTREIQQQGDNAMQQYQLGHLFQFEFSYLLDQCIEQAGFCHQVIQTDCIFEDQVVQSFDQCYLVTQTKAIEVTLYCTGHIDLQFLLESLGDEGV